MVMMVVYQIKVGVCLIAFYLLFKLLLSHDTLHRFNRVLLLVLVALSIVLPWVQLPAVQSTSVVSGFISIEQILVQSETGTGAPGHSQFLWGRALMFVYWVGMACVVMWQAWSGWRLKRLLGRGHRIAGADGTVIHLQPADDVAPFSFFRHIVISEADYRDNAREIISHEQAHIRLRHSYDVMLLNVLLLFQWWNPAAWLLKRELQQIHEFEADAAVLRAGVDARRYQLLLIRKSVGNLLFSMANNLNHSSLKRRIRMMNKAKDKRWRCMKIVAVVPVVAAAMMAFAHPRVEDVVQQLSEQTAMLTAFDKVDGTADENTQKEEQSMKNSSIEKRPDMAYTTKNEKTTMPGAVAYDVVEQMPEFPGGSLEMMKYFASHIRYPKEAEEQEQQGRVIVQFIIDEEGRVANPHVVRGIAPSIDAEALRVVQEMPKWRPGRQQGKVVRVKYTIPISFVLEGGKDGYRKASEQEAVSYVEAYKEALSRMTDFSMDNVTVVVDGRSVDNLRVVNLKDIKSMTVLKDAESLAKYGAQDKSAVVIIVTKQ